VRVWASAVCGLAGLRVRCHGEPHTGRPALYVANHASYLDIVVLGSLLDAAFIAKAEVAAWPLLGRIAKLGRTLFVERRPAASAAQRDAVAARLCAGDRLVLFAEGTSSDGSGVLRFKSSLFAAIQAGDTLADLAVQPITIAYGQGASDPCAPTPYAWYGDMTLLPHLWRVLGLSGTEVAVQLHPPLAAAAFACRKSLARQAEQIVAAGLVQLRPAA
jgi:1-acyl-sn-glycerol-3-phosphate acyltransferase